MAEGGSRRRCRRPATRHGGTGDLPADGRTLMGHRLSKIYTRTGDDGTTGLGDGTRVPKEHARGEAFGTVDELNSVLGLLLCEPLGAGVRGALTRLQHTLFDLGGER